MHVTLITITYGKRWNFLEQTLRSALNAGVDRVLIIDNEAEEEIAPKVAAAFSERVSTIRLDENRGSSGAYCVGLQAAMDGQAEYILLLDDDNRVEQDTLDILKRTWHEVAATTSADRFCLACLRPDFMQDVLRGRPRVAQSANAFFGLHVKDIPGKIWKRLLKPKQSQAALEPVYPGGVCRRMTAPFGGMFFHRSLIERYGYPDARLVLYFDDYEFSYRVSSGGGEVLVVPQARITDIDRSWGVSQTKSSFARIVELGSPRQVYYTVRNQSYFESHCRKPSWFRIINRAVWISIVWLVARLKNRQERFQLILGAIRDGERRLLGINPAYPPAK